MDTDNEEWCICRAGKKTAFGSIEVEKEVLGMEKPAEMTGESLLIRK